VFSPAALQQLTGPGIATSGVFRGLEGFCSGVNQRAGDAAHIDQPVVLERRAMHYNRRSVAIF